MISYRFKRGSASAIILSIAGLVFWATVAAIRLTLKALKKSVFFSIGFYIGYAAIMRERSRT